MAVHRIKKGLDLPISGAPEQRVYPAPAVGRVALLGDDTWGVRARVAVAEGEQVRRGQLLFEDRTKPGVRYTSPAAGTVRAVFRGARRVLRSVVIDLSPAEREDKPGDDEHVVFESWRGGDPLSWSGEQVRALMLESGLWTALRTRPFSRIPLPEGEPAALFVTATDSQPLAPSPNVALREREEDFWLGLRLADRLASGPTFLCIEPDSVLRGKDSPAREEVFEGPHPSGTVGLHIHRLCPVSRARSVWHLGYADVIALGGLARSGRLPVERIVSFAGPSVREPRLLRTRLGASLDDLCLDGIDDSAGEARVLSGSVLAGKKAMGPEFGFLGRYHLQVSALPTGRRRFLGWIEPGFDKFSLLPVFLSKLIPGKTFAFDTDTNGSHRPLMPIGTYEKVMPMDILPTFLLRSIVVGDLETAEALGLLELDEEDLALCSYVCPGKTEFGPYLRANLERFEKEG